MIRIAVLAMFALVCAASIADARPRGLHPDCNVTMPCEVAGERIARKANVTGHKSRFSASEESTRPDARAGRFITGRLVCAVNVNAALAARGIRGTGSALARSFLSWGRASGAVPGAVAVYSRGRGGHVAIVTRVEAGRVYVLNPSSRKQRWVETVYPRRALAYRVAG